MLRSRGVVKPAGSICACLDSPGPLDWLPLQATVMTLSASQATALLQGRRDARALPARLAEEQWEALGRRLRGIESSLQVSAALNQH